MRVGHMSQGIVGINLEELRVGTVCKHPVEDRRGMLLLGPNASITSDVLKNLRDREVAELRIDSRDVEAICVEDASPVALSLEHERKERIAKATPVKDPLLDCHEEPLSVERATELEQGMLLAKAHFEVMRAQLNDNVVLATDGLARSRTAMHVPWSKIMIRQWAWLVLLRRLVMLTTDRFVWPFLEWPLQLRWG